MMGHGTARAPSNYRHEFVPRPLSGVFDPSCLECGIGPALHQPPAVGDVGDLEFVDVRECPACASFFREDGPDGLAPHLLDKHPMHPAAVAIRYIVQVNAAGRMVESTTDEGGTA